MAGTTSSIGHTDTVDNVNGIPFLSAATAACTSPRRAYMPVKPTGAKATGIDKVSLNNVVSKLKADMSFNTRWRKAICERSSTFLFSVCSAYAPPSI